MSDFVLKLEDLTEKYTPSKKCIFFAEKKMYQFNLFFQKLTISDDLIGFKIQFTFMFSYTSV